MRYHEKRLAEQRRKGLALMAVSLAGFAALFGFAFWHDSNLAKPARYIGLCHGRLLAAMEESSFPRDCDWLEPIRYNMESGK